MPTWRAALLACLIVVPGACLTAQGTTVPGDVSASRLLRVLVRDARSREPVPDAQVLWTDASGRRAIVTDARGAGEASVQGGDVLVEVRRLGYAAWRAPVRTVGTGTARPVVIELTPVAATLQAVEVRSRALGGTALQASTIVTAAQLAERMSPSIAAMIAAEPGVSMRTNGPMASQPVIRGLGGDRVLVLEDGARTGDIATTAPDHAVTIDPAAASRIEVIRGPAGLLYGSNTLGGVVNVIRDDILHTLPTRLDWRMSTHGETVNRGGAIAGRASGAVKRLAWHVDGTTRTAGDTRTPGGVALPFTDHDGFEVGTGVSLVARDGHVGAAAREYRTFYGVPSSFAGVTLPGAHDGGVYVDVRRSSARADAEWRPQGRVVEQVSVAANAVRFEQAEFEQGGFVGTRFGQLASTAEVVARLAHGRHRGAVGVATQWRDLRAVGSFTGTRPAVQRTLATFAVDEITIGRATLLAGARVDRSVTRPLDSTETLLLRNVRTRAFTALTGAVGARMPLGGGVSVSAQVARAFRPPSIEELYSAGPHLASYAYEVGVPTLAAEQGLGFDGVLRWQGARGRAELSAYRMRVSDYITFAPQIDSATGAPLRDPRLRRYVVYRPQQGDAVLHGVEGRVVRTLGRAWTVDVSGAMPRGRLASGGALPAMPAATLRGDVRRMFGSASLGVIVDGRFAQRRVPIAPRNADVSCDVQVVDGEARALPAEFCPTPGVVLLGAVATVPLARAWRLGWQTQLTVSADNLLDARWRDPLWRAKQVAPQPGRNIRVSLQVTP